MKKFATDDPLDYRYYVDDIVLAKIKELVNKDFSSLAHKNLIESINVSSKEQVTLDPEKKDDPSEQARVVSAKQQIIKKELESPKPTATIDLKRSLDILRFGKDSGNPYYPKDGNLQAVEEFKQQYEAAKDIMLTHIGTDTKKVADIPSRVIVKQSDAIKDHIRFARNDLINDKIDNLRAVVIDTNTLKYDLANKNAEIQKIEQRLNSKESKQNDSLEQREQLEEQLRQAKEAKEQLRTDIKANLKSTKALRKEIKNEKAGLDSTDKDFKNALKAAESRTTKEERMSVKEFLSSIKNTAKTIASNIQDKMILHNITASKSTKEAIDRPVVLSEAETRAKEEQEAREKEQQKEEKEELKAEKRAERQEARQERREARQEKFKSIFSREGEEFEDDEEVITEEILPGEREELEGNKPQEQQSPEEHQLPDKSAPSFDPEAMKATLVGSGLPLDAAEAAVAAAIQHEAAKAQVPTPPQEVTGAEQE